jgi:hypothetical protein
MPLILETPDGRQRLALSIAGYEFPDPEYTQDHSQPNVVFDETDWNWLMIHVDVRMRDVAWSAERPSLLTREVEWLADWLEALILDRAAEPWREFLDGCFAFRADPLLEGVTRLRVYFGAEMSPSPPSPGRRRPPAWDRDNDVFLEFDLTSEQLRITARSLRAELSRYPARVPTPDERPQHTG